MSLHKWRKPRLLDRLIAQEKADKEQTRVDRVVDKVKKIIKKTSRKD